MKAMPYSENDHYAMLASWWDSWAGWVAIPPMMLPENGLVIYSDCGVPLCAGFLYKTDSCVAWAEHIISSKEAPKELRGGSVEFLINSLSNCAKDLGFKAVMSSIIHTGLINKMLSCGYTKTDLNMTNMLKVL